MEGICVRSSIRTTIRLLEYAYFSTFLKCLTLTHTALAPLSLRIPSISLCEKSGRIGTATHPTYVIPRYIIIQKGHDSPTIATLSPLAKPFSKRYVEIFSAPHLSLLYEMNLSSSSPKIEYAFKFPKRLVMASRKPLKVYSWTHFIFRPSLLFIFLHAEVFITMGFFFLFFLADINNLCFF